MDTWFTNEPFIKRVTEEGLHVIGMPKDNKQEYRYNEVVRVQLLNWFCSQPRFIQTLFRPFFSRLDSANCVPV